MPQFAGGFQAGALLFRYGPYDDVALSKGPKARWSLGALDPTAYLDYEDLALNFLSGGPPKARWSLAAKTSITYDDYETTALAKTPKARWRMHQIDTV
jgi:hypothetical protein